MPSHWRVIDSGPARGSSNMALDEALYRLAMEGSSPPTIRFYAWSPPALTIGYFQRWEREFDPDACRAAGVEVYRRITGGRAVLHRQEVTYSVTCGGDPSLFGRGVWPAYARIGQALAEGLRLLGVEATMVPVPSRRDRGGSSHQPACFSSAAGCELTAGGAKLAGSAQKRHGDAFLQHGSLLLSGHGRQLSSLLREPWRKAAARAAMTGLDELLGREAGYSEVTRALAQGFARAWGVELVPGPPRPEELELAALLERKRYLREGWNLRREGTDQP